MKTYFRVDFNLVNPITVCNKLGIKFTGHVAVFAVPNTELSQFEAKGKKFFPKVQKGIEEVTKCKVEYKITTISRSTYYRERNKCEQA